MTQPGPFLATPLDADAAIHRLFVERRPNHVVNPRGDTVYRFPEEHAPPSAEGGLVRVVDHPWFLVSWERLRVPRIAERLGPRRVRPYCCYNRTVIFYVKPYRVGKDGGFRKWGETEHALWHIGNELVEHEGESFRLVSGSVVWRAGHWWFRAILRRENA